MAQTPAEPPSNRSTQQVYDLGESLYTSTPPENARDLYQAGFFEGFCAGYQASSLNTSFTPTYLGSHVPYVGFQPLPAVYTNPQSFMPSLGYPQWPMGQVNGSALFSPPVLHQGAEPLGLSPSYRNATSFSHQNMQDDETQMASASNSLPHSLGASESSCEVNSPSESDIHSTTQGPISTWTPHYESSFPEDVREVGMSLLALRAMDFTTSRSLQSSHAPLPTDQPGTASLGLNDPKVGRANTFCDYRRISPTSGGCSVTELNECHSHPAPSKCGLPIDLPNWTRIDEEVVNETQASMQEGQARSIMDDGAVCPSPDEIMTSPSIDVPVSDSSLSAMIGPSSSKLVSVSSVKRHWVSSNEEDPSGLTMGNTGSRNSKVQKRRKKRSSQTTNVMPRRGKESVFQIRTVKAASLESNKHFSVSWSRRRRVWIDAMTGQEYCGSVLIQDYRLLSVSGRLAWSFDIDLYPVGGSWQGGDSLNTWRIRMEASSVLDSLKATTSCAAILCESELVE
ncbi:hypothetical protein HJFPF1_13622 [Paramyrothecium foliicola]|nr:hypothetical protein HJFPF1_13622 [Paramyrothecium foliicola]